MKYTSSEHGDLRVVRVSGSWTGGHDDDGLRHAFRDWIEAGERRFVIDLAGVDLLNSVGLGALVSYYTTLARHDGEVALSGMTDRHRRAAYVARILDLFEEYDRAEDAIDGLSS